MRITVSTNMSTNKLSTEERIQIVQDLDQKMHLPIPSWQVTNYTHLTDKYGRPKPQREAEFVVLFVGDDPRSADELSRDNARTWATLAAVEGRYGENGDTIESTDRAPTEVVSAKTTKKYM